MRQRLYYVADYRKLAVAECPEFGNALYYAAAKDWRAVFRKTKREALLAGAARITHQGDWPGRRRMDFPRHYRNIDG